MWKEISRESIMLVSSIDPIGTLALFVAVTAGKSPEGRRDIALRCILYSSIILISFLIIGQILLNLLGVRLVSFELAGGIILFLFGIKMIFGNEFDIGRQGAEAYENAAVYPLAMPSIANPGSILCVVLLTDNDLHGPGDQMVTALILVVILAVVLALLLMADRIYKVIGPTGSQIMVRVMGLLLSSLAVETIIQASFELISKYLGS